MPKDNIRTRSKRRRAEALMGAQQWREALSLYEQVVAIDRGDAQAWMTVGMLRGQVGDLEGAITASRRALVLAPRLAAAHYNLGRALAGQGDVEGAMAAYRAALDADPRFYNARYNLGNLLREQRRLEEAEEAYRQALEFRPDAFGALINLASVLRQRGEVEEAEQIFRRLLVQAPNTAELHGNLASVLYDQGRCEEARQALERAFALKADLAPARFTHSLLYLVDGEFDKGWDEYEWGLQLAERTPRSFAYSVWDGRRAEQETLLVYAEQGVGDEVMFASCIPDAMGRVGQCVIECDPRLAPLFRRSFPGATVVGAPRPSGRDEVAKAVPHIDHQIAAGSLPRLFRRKEADFPVRDAYLRSAPERVAAWRERLDALRADLAIGVSWYGGADTRRKRERSLPLECWAPLLGMPGVAAVNLQYGSAARDAVTLDASSGFAVHTFAEIDPLQELDDFSALISALDLVISVDNSTVHFAGALGTPTWVLLPTAPDWRWMREREDSPWYPSVRLFRQRVRGDWDDILERLREALTERLSGP